jgi:hypothetical protein
VHNPKELLCLFTFHFLHFLPSSSFETEEKEKEISLLSCGLNHQRPMNVYGKCSAAELALLGTGCNFVLTVSWRGKKQVPISDTEVGAYFN